ncbi:hypothetical protein VNO77_25526 [Canavalia gladiata]|uniref:Uncharacterized protein n=1 Tax=Canavalia gladiata TaxID=3824 RepID=A0AAN9L8T3_CANGL
MNRVMMEMATKYRNLGKTSLGYGWSQQVGIFFLSGFVAISFSKASSRKASPGWLEPLAATAQQSRWHSVPKSSQHEKRLQFLVREELGDGAASEVETLRMAKQVGLAIVDCVCIGTIKCCKIGG